MLNGKILMLAGAAALLPPVASQVSAQSADQASRPFAPPDSPLVLTRTVWRTLADGKEIVVRRRYAVQFTRHGDGFLLDGKLLDSAVDAPPLLAALASIERGRSDEGLFPLLLDPAGRILAAATAQPGAPLQRDNARERAQSLLASTPLPAVQRQETGAFLSQLAIQGAMAVWPADLFNPASGERRERRRIALPGGQEGAVDVSVKAGDAQTNGLPQAVERTVTTIMEGTSRTTRERWTLIPAAHPNL